VRKVIVILFWASVFLVFLTPMELGDVWWHLSTGKWIWENKALPEADPFSISSSGTKGDAFVLGGFWLFQLLINLVQGLFGIKGLIILKALIFTSVFSAIALALKNQGLAPPFRHLALLPAIFISTCYDETRPQTVSFLFFALTLLILERSRSDKPEEEKWLQPSLLLPAVMVFWANMHPGFVVGNILIAAYAAERILRVVSGRAPRPSAPFLIFCTAAIALSALNPNGIEAIGRTWHMIVASTTGTSQIHEHMPIKDFASFTEQAYLYHAIAGLIVLGLISFIIRFRRPDLFHLVIFCAFSYLSFKTFRAGFFFALAGSVIMGKNLSRLKPPGMLGKPFLQTASAILMLLLVSFGLVPRTIFRSPAMNQNLFPVKTSAFIEESEMPGNIYHPYEWGGYLIWRLYPRYKVFIDGRALGPMEKHMDILTAAPGWKGLIKEYGINTVMYWPLLPYDGSAPPLLLALLNDDGWSAVYWDLQGVVFTRADLTEKHIKKGAIWELLTSLITANILAEPEKGRNYSALGEIYLHRGLRHEAKRAFAKALELNPADRKAALWLKVIE
jgi:hypothetical protein